MSIKFVERIGILFFIFFIFSIDAKISAQSDISLSLKRTRGIEMLDAVKKELKDKYFDPNFHGIDIEKTYTAAKEDIKKAQRGGQISAVIAQFLLDLDDSHTFFIPDEKIGFPEYGFTMQMMGKTCYIISVKKGSDAEKIGIKIGDILYSIETFEPTRESLWKLNYFYQLLSPQEKLRIVLQNPDGSLRAVEIKAKLIKWEDYQKELDERKKKPKKTPFECQMVENETAVCRLTTFLTGEDEIDKLMKSVGQSKNLILDLRRNGGGYVKTLKYLVGYFFDKDVKVGTEKMRKTSKEEIAVTQGKKVFNGKLAVLIDSNSGSASEVFARLIQLEKRGTIIGDKSAGAVMTSIQFTKLLIPRVQIEFAAAIPYGASITVADLIMSDGKSLEKVGVLPEVLISPTGSDLASKRDVVLSRAASLFDVNLAAEKAGKLFQIEDADDFTDDEK
jgi:C-terminal processing protease CtpA/Prc